MNRIRLGISTCPNDTYAFHGLLQGRVDRRGIDFEVELLDIQQLNQRLLEGDFDVAKASFSAAVALADRMWVLPSGSALGFGVGPLLLSAEPGMRPPTLHRSPYVRAKIRQPPCSSRCSIHKRLGCSTSYFRRSCQNCRTKTLILGCAFTRARFTWQTQNLGLVEDLGSRWESETGCPLPLGGILASRSLPHPVLKDVQGVIYESLVYAQQHPEEALVSMRQYAQEFDDEVLMKHVELYVNEWTLDLGSIGETALHELSNRARSAGITATRPLQIFSTS